MGNKSKQSQFIQIKKKELDNLNKNMIAIHNAISALIVRLEALNDVLVSKGVITLEEYDKATELHMEKLIKDSKEQEEEVKDDNKVIVDNNKE